MSTPPIGAGPPPVPSSSASMPTAPAARSEAPPAPAVAKPPEVSVPKVDLPPIPKAEIKVDVEKLKAQLQEAIAKMNEAVKDGGRGLSFSVDKAVGGPVVVVKNVSTGEVIRQIPNEEAVKTAHDIERFRSVFINKLV
jgi:flagellar protein FlaG